MKFIFKSWLLRLFGRALRSNEVVFIDVPGFNDLERTFSDSFSSECFMENVKYDLRREFRIARAKVIVSACGAVKKEVNWGAKRVEVWHATGAIKSIRNWSYNNVKNNYVICSPSTYMCELYAYCFGASRDQVKSIGVPKTDLLLNKQRMMANKESFYSNFESLRRKRIYLFTPTFRGNPNSSVSYRPILNFNKISDLLREDEVVLVKLHPLLLSERGIHNVNFVDERIVNVSNIELELLLSVASVIVSDYSSVIYDSVLLNIPVVAYAEDIDAYAKDWGFSLNYKMELPFDILEEANETILVEMLRAASINRDKYERFKKKYLDACDGKSTQRVIELIEKLRNS
ncbi:CDP-glycerol glycerophosphotransferase family protein [Microbulbifer sp. TRSA002]|uniref:CDP-glycerol glycerophosphotransferase family protein n=1 Tax=Microbulbifer sp. TRSA002 TaxID=3243382 RepID=UPI004039467D